MDKRAHKDVTNTQEMTFFFFFKIHFIIPYVHFDFRILAVLKSPRAHRMAASVAGEAVSFSIHGAGSMDSWMFNWFILHFFDLSSVFLKR